MRRDSDTDAGVESARLASLQTFFSVSSSRQSVAGWRFVVPNILGVPAVLTSVNPARSPTCRVVPKTPRAAHAKMAYRFARREARYRSGCSGSRRKAIHPDGLGHGARDQRHSRPGRAPEHRAGVRARLVSSGVLVPHGETWRMGERQDISDEYCATTTCWPRRQSQMYTSSPCTDPVEQERSGRVFSGNARQGSEQHAGVVAATPNASSQRPLILPQASKRSLGNKAPGAFSEVPA